MSKDEVISFLIDLLTVNKPIWSQSKEGKDYIERFKQVINTIENNIEFNNRGDNV